MGRFISNFSTTAEYTTAQSTLETPHVSLTRDDFTVHYNAYVEPPTTNNIITYTASEKLAETTSRYTNGLYTNGFNTTIKSHTFENGTGTIEFNDDVTTILSHTFYNCTNLTSITIPDTVYDIRRAAFHGGSLSQGSSSMPNGLTYLGKVAYYYKGSDTSIVLEEGTLGIAASFTSGLNNNLTSVTIPNSVICIGSGAFSGCQSLTSVTIPNSVTSIGLNAFSEVNYITCNGVTYTRNGNSALTDPENPSDYYAGYYITLGNGSQAFISISHVSTCCFVAGTQVTMGDLTTKNIENVQVGDSVLSYDLDNNTNIVTTVKKTIVHENTTDIATIILENGYTATMNEYHPILCSDGWHSITNYNGYPTLAEGNMVKTQDGYSRLVSLQRTVVEPFITYNLDVVENHEVENDVEINDNYYANGICAHNAGCQ